MQRSILIVSALGFTVLLGSLVSRGDSPDKSVDGIKQPVTAEMKKQRTPEPIVRRTGTAAIEAALEQKIPLEFVETPLKDLIEYIRDATKIEIWLDEQSLKDAAVDPETPVTCLLRSCRLASALDIILDKHGLTWTIHDDVLWITSPQKAESDDFMETQVYDVADLVVYQDKHGATWDDFDPLMDAMVSGINSNSWMENGRYGDINGASLGTAKVLVVSQTYRVHKKIAALLENIRKVAATRSGSGLPRRDRQPPPQMHQELSMIAPGRTGFMDMGPSALGKAASPPANMPVQPAAR